MAQAKKGKPPLANAEVRDALSAYGSHTHERSDKLGISPASVAPVTAGMRLERDAETRKPYLAAINSGTRGARFLDLASDEVTAILGNPTDTEARSAGETLDVDALDLPFGEPKAILRERKTTAPAATGAADKVVNRHGILV